MWGRSWSLRFDRPIANYFLSRMSMEVLKTPNGAIKFRIFLEDKKKGRVGQGKIKGEVKA